VLFQSGEIGFLEIGVASHELVDRLADGSVDQGVFLPSAELLDHVSGQKGLQSTAFGDGGFTDEQLQSFLLGGALGLLHDLRSLPGRLLPSVMVESSQCLNGRLAHGVQCRF
jgi:hypothetical protein